MTARSRRNFFQRITDKKWARIASFLGVLIGTGFAAYNQIAHRKGSSDENRVNGNTTSSPIGTSIQGDNNQVIANGPGGTVVNNSGTVKNQVVGTVEKGAQVGDKNYYGFVKPRHLTKGNLADIIHTIPLMTSPIRVLGIGQDEESQNFFNEIVKKLADLQYTNLNISGHAIVSTVYLKNVCRFPL
jgi:hypothetical protein